MKKKLSKLFSTFILLFSFLILFPVFTFAQTTTITSLIVDIGGIIKAIIPVLLSLAVVYFIWGVTKYIVADSDEGKKKGKDTMIYGIIGLTVIFGLWGIINFLITDILGGQGTLPTMPAASCSAVPPPSGSPLSAYLDYITCIINKSVIPLIFALATAVFLWGMVRFLFINVGEETKREQGKQFMIWGVIALAVMLSVWGLVGVLRSTFNLGSGSILPQVHPPGGGSQN